jgi:hypothetical protein
MSLRIVLIASGIVGLIFGLFFLFAADAAISSFQLGASDVASRLFARAEGAALISLAVANLLASADRGSTALRGLVVGNLLIHILGIIIDFTETYPRTGGWWVGLVVHVIFIIAFGYYLLNWQKVAKPAG